jgi:phosphocarrier protein
MHARPAARLVKLASSFQSHIELVKDGLAINGKSIMGVMMLAAECGAASRSGGGPDARPRSTRFGLISRFSES